MIYFTNSIPNVFLTAFSSTRVNKISPMEAFNLLTEDDNYADYDDNVVPCQFINGLTVAIGHDDFADRLSGIFTEFNGTLCGEPIPFNVPSSRVSVKLSKRDIVIAAIVITPERRGSGQWTQDEISSFPIEFLMLFNGEEMDADHEWRYEMTKYA